MDLVAPDMQENKHLRNIKFYICNICQSVKGQMSIWLEQFLQGNDAHKKDYFSHLILCLTSPLKTRINL